ncbi:MAG: efflux RND transporter periplasmic adaptor subunit [Verrucomicrobiota bacterium]|nr:efflux RND transporter periplasmic adaptor subunit [Verrucomicrobiota bacterium]
MSCLASRLLACLLPFAAGCARHDLSGAAENFPPAKVHLATVRFEELPAFTEVTGTVRPVRHALLAAKVMGAIDELPVTLGQHVRAGDLLVKISAGEISARLQQAQAQLNQVKRDLERERTLLEKNASTPETVRSLEDRFTMTQAMVREAAVMLGYTIIRAPFDGVIARKPVDIGDLASPGQPLLEIEGCDAFQIETGIPDSLAGKLAIGEPLAVSVDGVTFTGALVELSSAADSSTRTVAAKISVPADVVVRSGQFARVQVPGAPVRALFAPAAAVTTLGQMERVFVADEKNRAVLRLVKTGAMRGERIEILSGLDDGERIVVAPPAGLREGQPLEMLP